MNRPADLDALSPDELRTLVAQLMAQIGEKDGELHYRRTRIGQLSHEIAVLKRLQFGKRSEQFTAEQMSLIDEVIDADLAALEIELEQLQPAPADKQRQKAKRAPLPPHLPRTNCVLLQKSDGFESMHPKVYPLRCVNGGGLVGKRFRKFFGSAYLHQDIVRRQPHKSEKP